MYTDRKSKKAWWLAAAAILVLCAGLLIFINTGSAGRDFSQEAAASIKETVERAALQCYAVEGAYPPDLEYLLENYGLAVNTRDYYIRYDAFASNQPPSVRVEEKETGAHPS